MKEKISNQSEAFNRFIELKKIVQKQRKEFLRQFNYEDLLEYASVQDVQRFLLDIYIKTTNSVGAKAGGMKNSPRAVWSRSQIPIAILNLYERGEKVSNESIKNELETFPGARNQEGVAMFTENQIKKQLASFNASTEEWLNANKQRD